jgi:hypothetical protein
VPADGLAPPPPGERPALPESQPLACLLATDVEGVPLLLNRLWSGCHFCRVPEVLTLAFRLTLLLMLLLTLAFRLISTFLSMSMSTSPCQHPP